MPVSRIVPLSWRVVAGLLLVIAVGSLVASAADAEPSGSGAAPTAVAASGDRQAKRVVTRAEYRQVKPGMSRDRVERIFGAGGGCSSRVEHGHKRFYPATTGSVSVEYAWGAQGILRVILHDGKAFAVASTCGL
ncbi:hypothetical protein GCM10023340_09810 [Nocardioides marinquilinus]|uniref:Outer membrane protein assembly factor BamE n=1 Tax=Nocardioides marinquilinus TaxID=1210400 RepID=A0ABP9PB42_9ACTN